MRFSKASSQNFDGQSDRTPLKRADGEFIEHWRGRYFSSTVARRAIGVLSIGEAAARLDMSRGEFESLIDRGLAVALPIGLARMVRAQRSKD